MTKAQLRALRWLRDYGPASPDRYGRMVAGDGTFKGFTPATFLRLVCCGYVAAPPFNGSLHVTEAGLKALRERGA